MRGSFFRTPPLFFLGYLSLFFYELQALLLDLLTVGHVAVVDIGKVE